jgi:hypothetical protein
MKAYVIRKRGDKWVVMDEAESKVLGTHDSEEEAKKQLAAIEASKARAKKMEDSFGVQVDFEDLTTISEVDIFAVGTWRGVNSPPEGDKYEEQDLQAMVDAFNAQVVQPNIKITHGADNEQVDIGRVANLKVKAGKLWADLVGVPKALYELMKKGLFKARSAEVLWNVKQGEKTWPRVLKAVALLAPGQKPAVSGISEGYEFEALYCYEWPYPHPEPPDPAKDYGVGPIIAKWKSWAGDHDACVRTLSGKAGISDAKALCAWLHKKAEGKWPAQHQAPDDYQPTPEELLIYFQSELIKEDDEMDEETKALMKKYNCSTLEELDAKLTKLNEEADERDKKVKEYEAEREQIRTERRKQVLERLSKEGKVLPRHAKQVERLLEVTDSIERQVSYELEDGKKKEVTLTQLVEDVFSTMPNLVEFKERSPDGDETGAPAKTPGAEVDRLVSKYRDEGKAKTYAEALDLVRLEHPDVWKQYAGGVPGSSSASASRQ